MKCVFTLSTAVFLLGASLQAEQKPNVVFIYGDDVGYGDVGVYGSKKIPTPNIDALAKSGIMFTDGHCTAATCTPSRFSLLTGVHGFRHKIRILPPDGKLVIPTDEITLPKLFKKAGYHTAVVGKWHLGLGAKGSVVDWNKDVKPGPLEVGFDYSFLLPVTNDRVPCVYLEGHKVVNLDPKDPLYISPHIPGSHNSTVYPNGNKGDDAETIYQADRQHNNSIINKIGRIGVQVGGKSALWKDETMADVFMDKATQYIQSRPKDQPFFLYFSSQDIHVPRAPHPRFTGKTELSYRGDAMVQFDWSTGAVVKALEEAGVRDNTIIVFSSDNGPVYDDGYADGCKVHKAKEEVDRGHDGSGPFKGGKYSIYEGGTRVPFIISWPKGIKAGQTSDALVSQIDFMSSFAELLEIELKEGQAKDSRNMLDTFTGKSSEGLPNKVQEAFGKLALRVGNWKYIPGKTPQLYDLSKDKGEKNNLAATNKERVKEFAATLQKLRGKEGVRKAMMK